MKSALTICLIFVSFASYANKQGPVFPGEIRHWNFQIENREVSLRLLAPPGKHVTRLVLSLDTEGDFIPTVKEEADLLSRVLPQISSLGHDLSTLSTISTPLQKSQYLQGVEDAVFRSGKWKSCIGQKYCYEGEKVADRFLTTADAFDDLDIVLKHYSLRRGPVLVDDMAVRMESGKVLCTGGLIITIEKQ